MTDGKYPAATRDVPIPPPPEHPDPPPPPRASHVELAVMAVRHAALLHPMPKEGERMDSRDFEIAQAYGIAGMLADAVDCLNTALERIRRDQETLAESLITIQNRVHPEALYVRNLPSGHVITVYKHHGGLFAVCIGAKDSGFIDDAFYYTTEVAAVTAAVQWSGHGDAPVGWFRHPQSGRRREDGDPARETVRA
jgi:hypothetical protein